MPINIYKPIGVTPLELIKKYKNENDINEKMSFAGRLDPMAHGEMILLKGEECKSQSLYCGKDKIYEFKVLYGFKTDTLDILGFVEKTNSLEKTNLDNLKGKFNLPYPHYSSIYVKKKPLWWWAKNGKIDEIEIPKKEIEIYELDQIYEEFIDKLQLLKKIKEKISKISLENREKFRYKEIKKKWEDVLDKECKIDKECKPVKKYKIETFRAKVSSGTYIRSLCERMGGIAIDINRINIII